MRTTVLNVFNDEIKNLNQNQIFIDDIINKNKFTKSEEFL